MGHSGTMYVAHKYSGLELDFQVCTPCLLIMPVTRCCIQAPDAPELVDTEGSSIRAGQLRDQLRSMNDELNRQKQETERLQQSRASNDFQLKQSIAKQQAAEDALVKQSEEAAAAAAEADATLERQSKEAAAAAEEAEAALAKASDETAAAAAEAAAANAAAAEAVAVAAGGEEGNNGPVGLLNGLGIFIGGGLGGYVYLQRKGNEVGDMGSLAH